VRGTMTPSVLGTCRLRVSRLWNEMRNWKHLQIEQEFSFPSSCLPATHLILKGLNTTKNGCVGKINTFRNIEHRPGWEFWRSRITRSFTYIAWISGCSYWLIHFTPYVSICIPRHGAHVQLVIEGVFGCEENDKYILGTQWSANYFPWL